MIKITQEMLDAAKNEVSRRSNFLNPHFNLNYLNENTRQIIGFLGEFSCQEYLGINWRDNIRDNYIKPDDCDFIHNGLRVDIKTETLPNPVILESVIHRTIDDNIPYGRRLIVEGQYPLLKHYDLVMFGAILRPTRPNNWSPVGTEWYPIGMISSQYILENYQPVSKMPFGSKNYPQRCVNIRTSELIDIQL